MRLFGLLNLQGLVGLAAALALGSMILVQKAETRHWHKQSSQFEQLYRAEQSAFERTVASYRAAAAAARAADQGAADRVRAEQRAITERTIHDYEIRLAALRDRAGRLQHASPGAAADPCAGRTTHMSTLSVTPCRTDQAAAEDRLPAGDARIASEQAIQLGELIRWVERQSAIDPNASR